MHEGESPGVDLDTAGEQSPQSLFLWPRVDQAAGNTPVSKRLLDHQDVAGRLVDPRGVSVAKAVRRDLIGKFRLPDSLGKPSLELPNRQPLSLSTLEDGSSSTAAHMRTQLLEDVLGQKNPNLPAALSVSNSQLRSPEIHILDIESYRRSDPQAASQ